MSIPVQCPNCKAEFKVSDKFAGKQGPCPKCKTTINVPKLDDDVKIHAPEEAATTSAASQARQAAKPIPRREVKISPFRAVLMGVGVIGTFAAAKYGGEMLQSMPIRALALVLVSMPTIIAGYSFLREDELEPYQGRQLWFRTGICTLVYCLVWAGYLFIPPDLVSSGLAWAVIAPICFVIGATAAYFCFDIEFGSAFFHYAFYVLVTMSLGWLAGLSMPWYPKSTLPGALPQVSALLELWLGC